LPKGFGSNFLKGVPTSVKTIGAGAAVTGGLQASFTAPEYLKGKITSEQFFGGVAGAAFAGGLLGAGFIASEKTYNFAETRFKTTTLPETQVYSNLQGKAFTEEAKLVFRNNEPYLKIPFETKEGFLKVNGNLYPIETPISGAQFISKTGQSSYALFETGKFKGLEIDLAGKKSVLPSGGTPKLETFILDKPEGLVLNEFLPEYDLVKISRFEKTPSLYTEIIGGKREGIILPDYTKQGKAIGFEIRTDPEQLGLLGQKATYTGKQRISDIIKPKEFEPFFGEATPEFEIFKQSPQQKGLFSARRIGLLEQAGVVPDLMPKGFEFNVKNVVAPEFEAYFGKATPVELQLKEVLGVTKGETPTPTAIFEGLGRTKTKGFPDVVFETKQTIEFSKRETPKTDFLKFKGPQGEGVTFQGLGEVKGKGGLTQFIKLEQKGNAALSAIAKQEFKPLDLQNILGSGLKSARPTTAVKYRVKDYDVPLTVGVSKSFQITMPQIEKSIMKPEGRTLDFSKTAFTFSSQFKPPEVIKPISKTITPTAGAREFFKPLTTTTIKPPFEITQLKEVTGFKTPELFTFKQPQAASSMFKEKLNFQQINRVPFGDPNFGRLLPEKLPILPFGGLPDFQPGFFTGSGDYFKGLKRAFKYAPDLTSIVYNIRGKKPKPTGGLFTGLELRKLQRRR